MERELEGIELRTINPADRVALRGVRLRARLSGMCLKATLEQTFVNQEDRAIEAVYTFPLIEGAAVCGFEVVTGDHVLTGKIEETGDAIEKYEKAVSEGHGAYMAEQERPDVFTIRVGNLKPKQAATIRLTLIAPLEIAEKSIRVAFPTTVAPRYVSAAGTTDPLEAQIDGDSLNPPHVLHVPYGLMMEVEVDLGRTIRAIASPTHGVTVQSREDGTALVTFAGGIEAMNRDVVLSITTAKDVQPSLQVAGGPGAASYLAVTFIPDFHDEDLAAPPASETLFVLDCSGSMQGESIIQATAALELCLRSLSEGDTFNICRFGSTFQLMSSEPLRYDARTLKQAIAYVRQNADLGGTELFAPLQAIFSKPPAVGAVRQVILLTDGQISNEPAVIDLARRHRHQNRVFSFGIGTACSAHLVKGLARATGGAAEFISGNERIEEKVLRTFGRISSPQVTDVKVDWSEADVQTLAELPPVFEGEVLTVFGRCAGRLPAVVKLSCNTPQGLRTWPILVGTPGVNEEAVIATMWARRTIQSLEEVNGVRRTSVSDRAENRAKQEMIRLSKEFGILCSLTTFITVEHRSLADRNEGRPELRKVPTTLAAGWGGMDAASAYPSIAVGGVTRYAAAPSAPASSMSIDIDPDGLADSFNAQSTMGFGSKTSGGLGDMLRKLVGKHKKESPAKKAVPPPPGNNSKDYVDKSIAILRDADRTYDQAGPEQAKALPVSLDDHLKDLLNRQSAEGWFGDSPAIDAVLSLLPVKLTRAGIENNLIDGLPASSDATEQERLIRTFMVLYLFKNAFGHRTDWWKRAHRKAVQWLGKVASVKPSDIDTRLGAVSV